jgi:hypothetical protein
MRHSLPIISHCTVTITIPTLVLVKTLFLVCSSWWNIPTLTYKMQLACKGSISCNFQHLTSQSIQCWVQSLILHKRALYLSKQAYISNWQAVHPMMKFCNGRQPRLGRRNNLGSRCNTKQVIKNDSCTSRKEEKSTVYVWKRQSNRLWIQCRPKPLWERSQLTILRQGLVNSRKILELLTKWDSQPESQKDHGRSFWMQ